MEIYRDGVLWHSGTGLTRPLATVLASLRIGKENSNYYPGLLDEFRIYTRVLTAAQALSLTTTQPPAITSQPRRNGECARHAQPRQSPGHDDAHRSREFRQRLGSSLGTASQR